MTTLLHIWLLSEVIYLSWRTYTRLTSDRVFFDRYCAIGIAIAPLWIILKVICEIHDWLERTGRLEMFERYYETFKVSITTE